ncbi:MAG TPA: helix-turn-helix transcriptional regulator [Chitinophagaceae bacterium]|nr:helix-turn-helix transcriptional regulator [Chitinophagaceae bacterium]
MNNQSEEIEKHFGHIASLIGEKSRAIMLWNLLDGRAYTATELAIAADVSFQSASNHLAQLINAKLLLAKKQGRHKYYRFANDRVAQAIENIAGLMPVSPLLKSINHSNLTGIKYARTCYDHLAGKIGVQLTHSLIKNKWLITYADRYEVSTAGTKQFENIGIDISAVQKQSRKFAYPCLDWSERNHHLGGALGAALLQSMIQNDWVRKLKYTRELVITGKGKVEMSKAFKTTL